MNRSFRRLLRLWVLALISGLATAILVIALVEGVHWIRLKNWGPHPGAAGIQFDSGLGWAPIPDYFTPDHGGIRFNTAGFRSPEIRPNVPTIAMIGDSVVFGIGLANDRTPSAALGALVAPFGVQVQNLGVAGYGPDQTLLRLQHEIDRLPDLRWVIFVVCSDNDLGNCRCNFAEGKKKPLFEMNGNSLSLTSVPIAPNCARNHLETSPLGPWIWKIHDLAPGSGWLPRAIGDRCLDDEEVEAVADAVVARLRDLTVSRGVRFSAIVIPHRDEIYGPPEKAEWWEETLRRRGIEAFDFRTHLVDRGLTIDEVYGDPVHMNENGSRVLGGFLFSRSPWAEGGESRPQSTRTVIDDGRSADR